MRSEKQMMDLILGYARGDERVRAVAMNGSRTNPNVPKDRFQDFDIVYLVTEMDSFIRDSNWIDVFGERIIMQKPEDMSLFPAELGGWFSYLMLFADGNRIDLILVPLEDAQKYAQDDKLTVVLLDKDGLLPPIAPPTDIDYHVKRPSAEFYADCCNEFWWVSTYVAKGLWRKEILYAIDHLELMRKMLLKMLEWKVGIDTDYALSIGKNGKYLDKHLPERSWNELLSTYPGGTYDGVWNALFGMVELFRRASKEVADCLEFAYPEEDDRRVTAYLEHVRRLPPDANRA
ncbi:aminoglycoside 6-adenylyltransferase [Paenibacillaceae bacterium WGS1546]|uniref:aminoglycoside 6-adenylyltransferase n=1 Tax=Cohnella sp. WGS1546 TaxID=3366810 RepID=UPI00372D5DF4